MSVVIDDVPYPRFPITPREGLVLTIGGQKRVIDRIEVSLDTLEIRCETRPEKDSPENTNAEEPESDANAKTTPAEEVSRRRSAGGGSTASDGDEMSQMRSGEAVVSMGKAPRRQSRG